MSKIWTDESVSEYDMLAEDAKKAEELAQEYDESPAIVEADEEQLEEISDEAAFELSQTESNTVYNARLRLEQAKLYELLINHNLFEGVDASEQAVKNVQNELKFYILKRLEILLGIREPVVRVEAAVADPQFNEVEVDFLKQLAYKGTFGRSVEEAPAPAAPKPVTPKPMALKPVTPAQKLKAMTTPKKVEVKEVVKETPKPEVKKAAVPTPPPVQTPVARKPVPQPQSKPQPQAAAPARKPAVPSAKVKNAGMGRDLTKAEAEAIAREDLKTASGKAFHEMNAKEKAKRIAEMNARNPRPRAVSAQPMPTPDQIKMKYMTQQESAKDGTTQFNNILAATLAAKKNSGDE